MWRKSRLRVVVLLLTGLSFNTVHADIGAGITPDPRKYLKSTKTRRHKDAKPLTKQKKCAGESLFSGQYTRS